MHKFILYTMLVTLASFTGDFRSVRAGQPQDSAAEQKAILDIVERFHAEWNRGDAAAVAALFSPDGEFVSPSGAVTSTRPEIRKLLTGEFQQKFQGTTLTTSVDTIHFVQKDAALAKGNTSSWEWTYFSAWKGQSMAPSYSGSEKRTGGG